MARFALVVLAVAVSAGCSGARSGYALPNLPSGDAFYTGWPRILRVLRGVPEAGR